MTLDFVSQPIILRFCSRKYLPLRTWISVRLVSHFLSYDDLMDLPVYNEEGATMHKKEGVSRAGEILMRVFVNQDEFRPVAGHPVITTFHE